MDPAVGWRMKQVAFAGQKVPFGIEVLGTLLKFKAAS